MKSDEKKYIDHYHIVQLFKLFYHSEFDLFELITKYSVLHSRKLADEGHWYYIFLQPTQSLHEIERMKPCLKRRKYDPVIVDWMAEIYSYAVEEQDVTFEDAVNAVSPEWLYNHYSPLHETSIQNGWCKAEQCNKSI